jgi:hypothetical protein
MDYLWPQLPRSGEGRLIPAHQFGSRGLVVLVQQFDRPPRQRRAQARAE